MNKLKKLKKKLTLPALFFIFGCVIAAFGGLSDLKSADRHQQPSDRNDHPPHTVEVSDATKIARIG